MRASLTHAYRLCDSTFRAYFANSSVSGKSVLAQLVLQVLYKMVEITLCLGFIAKWADIFTFPDANVPKVLLGKNTITALRWSGTGVVLLA